MRATLSTDPRQLFGGLDAFGCNGHAKAGAETCDGAQNGFAVGVVTGNEGPIDLDLVEGKLLQIAQ
ncbi:hypothetical protein D3C87_2193560 [compost metagenome]